MGFLLANGSWQPTTPLVILIFASVCLYSAGMVLNDFVDVERDRLERPNRPIPSGVVSPEFAKKLGWSLLMVGVACSWISGFSFDQLARNEGFAAENSFSLPWRSGVVGSLLAAAIIFYNFFAKNNILGPFAMGLCRTLNILLGMSCAKIVADWMLMGFSASQILIAIAIGVFIGGLTWLARNEATDTSQNSILVAGGVMIAGITSLGLIPKFSNELPWCEVSDQAIFGYVGLLVLICLPIVRRLVVAYIKPTPETVQQAVLTGLFSIIFFDAIICFGASDGQTTYSLVVASMLPVSMILGKWINST